MGYRRSESGRSQRASRTALSSSLSDIKEGSGLAGPSEGGGGESHPRLRYSGGARPASGRLGWLTVITTVITGPIDVEDAECLERGRLRWCSGKVRRGRSHDALRGRVVVSKVVNGVDPTLEHQHHRGERGGDGKRVPEAAEAEHGRDDEGDPGAQATGTTPPDARHSPVGPASAAKAVARSTGGWDVG